MVHKLGDGEESDIVSSVVLAHAKINYILQILFLFGVHVRADLQHHRAGVVAGKLAIDIGSHCDIEGDGNNGASDIFYSGNAGHQVPEVHGVRDFGIGNSEGCRQSCIIAVSSVSLEIAMHILNICGKQTEFHGAGVQALLPHGQHHLQSQ